MAKQMVAIHSCHTEWPHYDQKTDVKSEVLSWEKFQNIKIKLKEWVSGQHSVIL